MSGCEDDTKVSKFNHDGFNVYPHQPFIPFLLFLLLLGQTSCVFVCVFLFICVKAVKSLANKYIKKK